MIKSLLKVNFSNYFKTKNNPTKIRGLQDNLNQLDWN